MWASSWESMAIEPTEFMDVDADQLVVHIGAHGHTREPELEVTMDYYWLVRIREFDTHREALEPVGFRSSATVGRG